MPSSHSGSFSSRDPLRDWFVDMFGSGDRKPPKPPKAPVTGGTETKRPGRPTLVLLLAVAVSHLVPSALTAFAPTGVDPTISHALAQVSQVLTRLQVPLLVLAVVVAVIDVQRWNARRQRQRLATQVSQSSNREPQSVRITTPGLRHPRRAVVQLPPGTRLPEDKLAAVEDTIGAGARHLYSVRYDGPKDRLIVRRVKPAPEVPDTRSDRHRTLADAIDGSPFGDGTEISVHGHNDDGEETSYRISFANNLRMASQSFQTGVGDALVVYAGRPLEGRRWTLDWHPESGYVDLYMREALPTRVEHPIVTDYPTLLGTDRLWLPYATGAGGVFASWDVSMSSQAPHFLVVGPTGGGKTSLIRTAIVEGTRRGIPWLCADPKQIELVGCEAWPGVAAVAYELEDMVNMLSALHAEMMQRYRMIRVDRIEPTDLGLIGIVLDEFLIMSKMITRAAKSADEETKAWIKAADPLGIVEEILALGRSAGFRMLVGVQRPDARVFGDGATSARDNFRTRASLSRLSQQGAMMMWDDADAGTDLDQSVAGQATVSDTSGNPITAQVWWTPDVDTHPRKWAKLSDAERAQVEALRPTIAPKVEAVSKQLQRYLAGRTLSNPAVAPVAPDTHALADVDDAVAAKDITPGTPVRVDLPDGSELVAEVADVRRTRGGVVLILDREGRGRTELECEPDELIYTLDPALAGV